MPRGRRQNLVQVAEIDQRVADADHVEPLDRLAAQPLGELGLLQAVVDAPLAGTLDHRRRQVHAHQQACAGLELLAEQSGAAAQIERREIATIRQAGIQRRPQQLGAG